MISWIGVWRLRDRTLDYTSLITHFDDGYQKMKEKRGRQEKRGPSKTERQDEGNEREEKGRVWEK